MSRDCQFSFDSSNMGQASTTLIEAIRLLTLYYPNSYPLPAYVGKPKGTQFNMTQKTNDIKDAKKQAKNAVSEIDFSNIQGALNALYRAFQLIQKY